jgi:hypothetical protein
VLTGLFFRHSPRAPRPAPPQLETHACFPAPFKAAARAALLAHHRLAGAAAAAAADPCGRAPQARSAPSGADAVAAAAAGPAAGLGRLPLPIVSVQGECTAPAAPYQTPLPWW